MKRITEWMKDGFAGVLYALIAHEDSTVGWCASQALASFDRDDPPMTRRRYLCNLSHALNQYAIKKTHGHRAKSKSA